LFAYLRRQTRDAAFAEDVLQHTFLHMHRGRGTFIQGSSVFPWAFAIARRLVIDGARRGRRDLLVGAAEIDGDEDAKSDLGTADQEMEARSWRAGCRPSRASGLSARGVRAPSVSTACRTTRLPRCSVPRFRAVKLRPIAPRCAGHLIGPPPD
jgi:hypothetical protein